MQVIWCMTWTNQLTGLFFLNRDVSMLHFCNIKKINLILKLKLVNIKRINLTFVLYSLVTCFVSYVSAKYYLNWFSFHIVIVKVTGVNFFWNTVYIDMLSMTASSVLWCHLCIRARTTATSYLSVFLSIFNDTPGRLNNVEVKFT